MDSRIDPKLQKFSAVGILLFVYYPLNTFFLLCMSVGLMAHSVQPAVWSIDVLSKSEGQRFTGGR